MPLPQRPSSAFTTRREEHAEPVLQRPSSAQLPRPRPLSAKAPGKSAAAELKTANPSSKSTTPGQLAPLAKRLTPATPHFTSPFPFTSLPATTTEVNTYALRSESLPVTRPPRPSMDGDAAARLSGHNAWPVEDAKAVVHGGKVDWRKIADADKMIFRSRSLKLEAALTELNLLGSQVDSSSIMLGEKRDRNVRARGPSAFRTALCCRMLTSLTEEMVNEQHREVFRRISYELMLSIYDDYIPPPRYDLEQGASTRQLPAHDKAAETGLSFDFVPYYSKAQSLEEEMLLLKAELEELRAWKEEKTPILREQHEKLEIMARSCASSDLSAQIATVEMRRLQDKLDAQIKYTETQRAEMQKKIETETETGHSLRSRVINLQEALEKSISVDQVKKMQQQMADFVDVMRVLEKLVLDQLVQTCDTIIPSDTILQEGKNLGVLVRDLEGLQTLSDAAGPKAFLERWVAGKIDAGGESAGAEAAEDARYKLGYEWRDCLNLIQLILNCDPTLVSEKMGENVRFMGPSERANAVATHIGEMFGGSLIRPIELESGSDDAITLVAAALFLRYPQIRTFSKPVQANIQQLKKKVGDISDELVQLSQLIGSDKEHCKAKETEKDPKTLAPAKRLERNLERLKAQERYYDLKIESLQSFLRLCTRVRKSMVEGQVQRGQMLARLKEEREAWTKVYMNVTLFTLKQLSRKVLVAEDAVSRALGPPGQTPNPRSKSKQITKEASKTSDSGADGSPSKKKAISKLPLTGVSPSSPAASRQSSSREQTGRSGSVMSSQP